LHWSSADASATPRAVRSSSGRPRFFVRHLGVGSASVDTLKGDSSPILQLGLLKGLSLPDRGVDEARRGDAPAGGRICNAAAAKASADASEELSKKS
jgi:hypothetical protein